VSLFPQLVAGPIVRFRQIEADLENIDRAQRRTSLNIGWSFLVIGMIKKVLVADSLAAMINPALDGPGHFSTITAWLCMLGYTFQLYFDFSGYSDMAVGLGHLLGLRLPQNFNSPYKAASVADFWRRWHISLSTCLRDYLYIPMGGGRGPSWAVYRNVMITMLLAGLWHGASWTFVIWGGYHGLLLVMNRHWAASWEKLPETLRRAITFLLVVVGWVLFRSTSFQMAGSLLHAMFSWVPGPLMPWAGSLSALILFSGALAMAGPNTFEMRHEWKRRDAIALTLLFALCVLVIYGGQSSPFLYFQF
jgi:alginate O-acetyltransferase complex protein AlgI